MPDKKPSEPDLPAEEEVLKRQVDEMMSVSATDGTPAVSTGIEPRDIVKLGTAPKLPKGEVYKLKEPAKPPLVIKLADESSPAQAVKPTELPPEPELSEPTEPEAEPESTPIDDSATEEAVDDIAAKESDMVLALEDARAAKKAGVVVSGGPGWKDRLKNLFKSKKTWAAVAILLLLVLALPLTRYPLLGLVIKEPVTVTVLDSKTATPVSSAEVQLAGATAKTDGEGHAHLKAALGKHTLKITKQYYQDMSKSYFVGFKSVPSASVSLVATGRLVPITVVNSITGKPLKGAQISLKGTTAKTDSNGRANVALPTTASSYDASLTLSGYNSAAITVQVTDQAIKSNTFKLTPAGHIYFLSNLSGRIDVVKTNLDGSGRKTILSGTGNEDPTSTSLLASRDWRFLVLKAKRDTAQAALYLIDTSTDKVTSIDTNDADFTLVGWYGHDFIYDLTKSNSSYWLAGRETIKSYDADNLQLNQLDQNQAQGDSTSYAYQNFYNFYIVNGLVVYNTQWTNFNNGGTPIDLTGKTATIRAVQPNGQNKKDYETFAAATTGYIQAALYSPQAVYFGAYNNSNGQTSYFDFDNNAAKSVSLDNGAFTQSYPTFLLSPSGNQTFWTELRDGKNSLFIGDDNASSKKQIASLSDYSPYGWFSDSYVLVSQNSSELYIMPTGGLPAGQQPLKITDYYKPAQNFNGYGYGYGGL